MLGGLVLLVGGAEGLVRGASSLALRLGVAPLVVGLTIVALGTGSPELVLSVKAATDGNSGLALGNIVGSNISNIGLVLGLAAIVRPLCARAQIIRREAPLMIGATALLCVLLLDGSLGRLDGALLLACAVAYTVFAYVSARRGDTAEATEEFTEALETSSAPLWRSLLFLGVGLAALLGGANLLLDGAVSIATRLGISEVVVGLTIVAIGTSLPELATSVTAAYRNEPDVAFGNAIGSNMVNILGVLGLVALIHPFEAQGLRPLDYAALIASAVLVLPLIARGSRLTRWEGALLLMGYVAYIASFLV